MRTSRTIDFKKIFDKKEVSMVTTTKRDKDGRIIVPLYSDFFSSLTDNVMCTNAMFQSLHDEINVSISPYNRKEQIVLDIYESSETESESVRESVLVAFRKYIFHYIKMARTELIKRTILFLTVALVGAAAEFLLYGLFPDTVVLWLNTVIDIVAWSFVWQFSSYMAFEFIGEIKNINRLKQILFIEYKFIHWE